MRTRNAVLVATVISVAVGVSGCPSNSCPMETPGVGTNPVPSSCTALPGAQVTYPVRICPTCNQTAPTCAADLSAVNTTHEIFLDTKVEACNGSSSCPPSCQLDAITCTFTAPSGTGTYTMIVVDGATGQPISPAGQLTVIASGQPSCALPTASL